MRASHALQANSNPSIEACLAMGLKFVRSLGTDSILACQSAALAPLVLLTKVPPCPTSDPCDATATCSSMALQRFI